MDVDALEVRLFLEAIRARWGYDFVGYAADSMRRRVMTALVKSGCKHLGELQHRVLHDPAAFVATLDDLTIRVTSLFREPKLFLALRQHVVPLLRTYPQLRIWLAGCSTGEEAYSMAMLLTEEGLYERTQIYATDLSAVALERARDGTYQPSDLVEWERQYAEAGGKASVWDFFTRAYGAVAVAESLKRSIVFLQHDLISDHVFGQMHLVLCRNVLIYFGPEAKTKVMEKVRDSLVPGGFLALGSSERLGGDDAQHHFKDFVGEQRIYQSQGYFK